MLFHSFIAKTAILMLILAFPISALSLDSPAIDIYTQKGGKGPNQPDGIFAPGERVYIFANATYNGAGVAGKLVGFEVFDPQSASVLERTEETNQSGIAVIFFRIPQNGPPEHIIGNWTVIATVSISEQIVLDTLTFQVRGIMIDLYTQRNGIGPGVPSDAFAPQEEIIFYAYVTFDFDPVAYKLVGFQVFYPNGTSVDYRTAETNASGIAMVTLRIPTTPPFGTWIAIATVEIVGFVANDTTPFKVGWIVEILNLQTCDEVGGIKTNFLKGERINFILEVQNIAFVSKVATYTLSVYDDCKVPIGHVILQNWLTPQNTSTIFIIGIEIPEWSYLGVGSVYANAYTKLPILNGTAYCPEVSSSFQISL